MIKKLLMMVFTLFGAAVGYGFFQLVIWGYEESVGMPPAFTDSPTLQIAAAVGSSLVFAIIFFRIAPLLGRQSRKVADNIETDLQSVPADQILSGTFGLIVGLVIAYLSSRLFDGFGIAGSLLSFVTYVVMAYISVVVATKKGREVIPFLLATKKAAVSNVRGKSKNADATPKILDTSVIIDGRIADIMKTGFIEGPVVIPEFVLVELRHIADSSDSLKRNRGRRGLDILNKIQTEYGIEIYNTNAEKSLDEIPEVDIKLLKLAQSMNGKVVTNDFNLNKVALIKGVEVLNINELANTLKPVVLPSEDMSVFLVKEGKESSQAVAYLDDGTMIVVEEGRKHIGQTVTVTVTSVLQTSAGRMIFAKAKEGK